MPIDPTFVPDNQRGTPDNEFIYGPYAVFSDMSTFDSVIEDCCVAYITAKGQEDLESCNDFKAVEPEDMVHLTLSDLLDAYNQVHGTNL